MNLRNSSKNFPRKNNFILRLLQKAEFRVRDEAEVLCQLSLASLPLFGRCFSKESQQSPLRTAFGLNNGDCGVCVVTCWPIIFPWGSVVGTRAIVGSDACGSPARRENPIGLSYLLLLARQRRDAARLKRYPLKVVN